jgi:hypothetical protein
VLDADLCTACHPGAVPNKAVDFSTLEKAYTTLVQDKTVRCNGKPYVAPSDLTGSYLWDLVSKDNPGCGAQRMPAGLPRLSAEQLLLVQQWIESGAQR